MSRKLFSAACICSISLRRQQIFYLSHPLQGLIVHSLGHTRSSQKTNHALLTPDTFVRITLHGMKKCMAIVHASTAMNAGFAQYTAEFEAGSELGDTAAQR